MDILIREELEEGELSESDKEEINKCIEPEPYNPITRPNENNNILRPRVVNNQCGCSSDEQSSSSESDSENECSFPKKKRKLNRIPKFNLSESNSYPYPQFVNRNEHIDVTFGTKKRRNNIWANVLQEEELTSEIGGVGLKRKMKPERDVETYDYTLALHDSKRNGAFDSKAKGSDDSNDSKSSSHSEDAQIYSEKKSCDDLRKKIYRKNKFFKKKDCRKLVDISPNDDLSDEEFGTLIADSLFEQKPEIIIRVVEVLGRQKALEIYSETQKIEKKGGMMTMNGSRRRTSGGVYLYILRGFEGVEKKHLSEIFSEQVKEHKDARKRKRNKKKQKQEAENDTEMQVQNIDAEPSLLDIFTQENDVGATKCPSSTPASSPVHSDGEGGHIKHASQSQTLQSSGITLNDVCERAVSQINGKEVMDTC